MEYFPHWLAPLRLLVKLKDRVLPGRPATETVSPAPVTRPALGLSLVGQRLLGWLDIPFGASLYVRSVRADT